MRFWKNNSIPQTPFYACIFASQKSDDLEGYAELDKKTLDLAMEMDGFLGYEQAGDYSNGIFISYWRSREDIKKWSENSTHLMAKAEGRKRFYKRYLTQICLVERSMEMEKK